MTAPAPILPPPPLPGPVLVGFSGGLDSTVLLHLLAADAALRARGLRAIHVHHGLHGEADAWARHCGQACAALGVPLEVARVKVDRSDGLGLEAAARRARYAAFGASLDDGEILALAHHRDDQAETFLLRALRGSGVDGLGAMRPWRRLEPGWLWRPLLDQPRDALHRYARERGLDWVEDPCNAGDRHDRNHLRLHVLPRLRERWPHADAALARSAALAAQATDLLAPEDARALAAASPDPQVLDIGHLLGHPQERRARILRLWIERLALPPLPASGVAAIESDLLGARADAGARFDWSGATVRRWRDMLHAANHAPALPSGYSARWDGRAPLRLPTGDTLALERCSALSAGADPNPGPPLTVHARRGGERIVLPGRGHSQPLKHVLQSLGVPPWVRERLPLLSAADGTLLAAGDLALADGFEQRLADAGLRLAWHRAVAGRHQTKD